MSHPQPSSSADDDAQPRWGGAGSSGPECWRSPDPSAPPIPTLTTPCKSSRQQRHHRITRSAEASIGVTKPYSSPPTNLRSLRDRLTQVAERQGVVFGRL